MLLYRYPDGILHELRDSMQAFLEELAACALPEPGKVGPDLDPGG